MRELLAGTSAKILARISVDILAESLAESSAELSAELLAEISADIWRNFGADFGIDFGMCVLVPLFQTTCIWNSRQQFWRAYLDSFIQIAPMVKII